MFVPGEAGILAGRRATVYELSVHRDNRACLEGYGARSVSERICVDGNLLSCTGPAVSEEAAAWLLGKLVGKDQAEEIARFRLGLQ